MASRAGNRLISTMLSLTALIPLASISRASGINCPDNKEILQTILRQNDARIRNGGKSPETKVNFIQGRSLYMGRNSYLAVLGTDFFSHVHSLRTGDRWIDIGAGPEMKAMRDYFYSSQVGVNGKATLVPINVTDTITSGPEAIAAVAKFKADSGAETHVGKTVEEYKKGEVAPGILVTDAVSAISYSPHLPEVLENVGNFFLVEKGHFDSVMFEEWANEPCISIINQFHQKIALVDYLKSIQGMKLIRTETKRFEHQASALMFTLERTTGDVSAPPLELIDFNGGNTNGRHVPQITYRWIQ